MVSLLHSNNYNTINEIINGKWDGFVFGWLININYYVIKKLEGNHIGIIYCAQLQGSVGVV